MTQLASSGNRLYAGALDGLYVSDDAGRSFVPVEQLRGRPVHAIAAGRTLYVPQPPSRGNTDVVVRKLAPDLTTMWTREMRGLDDDTVSALALDRSQTTVYIAGTTASRDFPVTAGAVQLRSGGATDAFVASLSATTGEALASTYFGGLAPESAQGLAVDDRVYIAGGLEDRGYIAGLPLDLSRIEFSEWRQTWTWVSALALDPFRGVVIGGQRFVARFVNGVQTYSDAFDGNAFGIAVDRTGVAHVVGRQGTDAAIWSRDPRPAISAILNGASELPGDRPASPGALMTVLGSGLTDTKIKDDAYPPTLGGVTVLFDGIPARLGYVSPTRIELQVPAQLPPGVSNMTVHFRDMPPEARQVPVEGVSPGILGFVEQTARIGDVLTIFATGLVDEEPVVEIGRVRAEVLGVEPYTVGIYRIQVRVPSGIVDEIAPVAIGIRGVVSEPKPVRVIALE